jgi:hypothetical protein
MGSLVKHWNLTNFVNSHAVLGSAEALIVGIVVPVIGILVNSYMYTKNPHPERSSQTPPPSCALRLAMYFINRPIVILLMSIPWSLLMSMNQAAYSHYAMNFRNSFDYSFRYDVDSYLRAQSIANAKFYSSYQSIVASSQRTLLNASNRRRLDESSSDDHIQLVYHSASWTNLLDASNDHQRLKDVCRTEYNIVSSFPCLNTSFVSVLPFLLSYPDCDRVTTNPGALSEYQQAAHFQDGYHTTTSSAQPTNILLSYAYTDACSSNMMDDLSSSVRELAVDDTIISISNQKLLDEDYASIIDDSVSLTVEAIALGSLVMIIWMRGVFCGLMTIYAVIVSLVSSAALIPLFDYESFSSSNIISIYMLFGTSCLMVLALHSSWRNNVAIGSRVTPKSFLATYQGIGWPMLFISLLTMNALFVRFYSPSTVLSQPCLLLGFASIVFYFEFHLLVIPVYILTARFVSPPIVQKKATFIVTRLSFGKWLWSVAADPDDDSSHGNNIWGTESTNGEPETPHAGGGHDDQDDTVGGDDASDDDLELVNDHGAPRPIETEFSGDASDDGLWRAAAPITIQPSRRLIRDAVKAQLVSRSTSSATDNIVTPEPNIAIPSLTIRTDIAIVNVQSSDDINSGNASHKKVKFNYSALAVLLWRIGVVSAALVCLFVIYVIATTRVNDSLPQIVSTSYTNLHDIVYALKNYKLALATSTASSAGTLSTNQSASFTTAASEDSKEYQVKLCWGLEDHVAFIDSEPEYLYDADSFYKYINQPTNLINSSSGAVEGSFNLLDDAKRLCEYVDVHRNQLNIKASWQKDRDCLYDQLIATMLSPSFLARHNSTTLSETGDYMAALLIAWASTSLEAEELLGVLTSNQNASSLAKPVWVCNNFTAIANMSSFIDASDLATSLENGWQDAMHYGSLGARQSNVATIIGSFALAESFIAASIVQSFKLGASIMVAAIFLVLLFSTYDLVLSIAGLVAVGLVHGIGVCVYLTIFSSTADITDLTIFLAAIGIASALPLFSILYYRSNDLYSQEEKISEQEHATMMDRLVNLTKLPSSLEKVSARMQQTLLGPTILIIVMSMPLLRSDLLVIRRAGQYLAVTISAALLVTLFILPTVIAVSVSFNDRCIDLYQKLFRQKRTGFSEASSMPLDVVICPDPGLTMPLDAINETSEMSRTYSTSPLRSPNKALRVFTTSATYGRLPSILTPTPRTPTQVSRAGSCASDEFGITGSQVPFSPAAPTTHGSYRALQPGASWLDTFRPRSLTSSSPIARVQDHSSPWLTPIGRATQRFFGISVDANSDSESTANASSSNSNAISRPSSQSTSSTQPYRSRMQLFGGRGSNSSLAETISSHSAGSMENRRRGVTIGELLESPTQIVLQQQDIDRRLQAIYTRRQSLPVQQERSSLRNQFSLRQKKPAQAAHRESRHENVTSEKS